MPTKYDTKNKKQGSWEKRVKEIYSKGKRRREEKKDTKSRMKKKKEPSVILGQYVYHSHQPGRVCTTVCNWKKSRVENPSRKVQNEG
jgi:hypothetical protein